MEILTERLRLLALSSGQLAEYLSAPDRLEGELGLPVSRPILTKRGRGAIEKKIASLPQVLSQEQQKG